MMFEADAKAKLRRESQPPGESTEAARRADSPAPLDPLQPSTGSIVEDVQGGTLTFTWRVDTRALESAHAGKRLRTDFCLRIADETRRCFVMLALPADASAVTLPFDEIRLKVGPHYKRPARVAVRWFLTLSLATSGPLFSSRESDLVIVASPDHPRRRQRRRPA
jgi:hypothetical protein